VQPSRDVSGAAIALFTARLHNPQIVSHKTTLQGVVYQLDAALQSIQTQKSGLVFIYDMSGSKYHNFDYELSQKILTMLKVRYSILLMSVCVCVCVWACQKFIKNYSENMTTAQVLHSRKKSISKLSKIVCVWEANKRDDSKCPVTSPSDGLKVITFMNDSLARSLIHSFIHLFIEGIFFL
jgi:hypothetical protein